MTTEQRLWNACAEIERLTAENVAKEADLAAMRKALGQVHKLPKPWLTLSPAARISWEEWDRLWKEINMALESNAGAALLQAHAAELANRNGQIADLDAELEAHATDRVNQRAEVATLRQRAEAASQEAYAMRERADTAERATGINREWLAVAVKRAEAADAALAEAKRDTARLREALGQVHKLPKPWLTLSPEARISWEEWDRIWKEIDAAMKADSGQSAEPCNFISDEPLTEADKSRGLAVAQELGLLERGAEPCVSGILQEWKPVNGA